MSDVKEVLGSYSTDITKTIEEELATITPDNLAEASVYLTRAGGKMLRPALTLITAEAVGGTRESALKSAAAIELIHTFSLIHPFQNIRSWRYGRLVKSCGQRCF